MNRLDLIIDALNSFTQRTVDVKSGARRMCCGDPIEEKHTQHCIVLKALAAARELQALQPVAYMDSKEVLFNHTTHPHLHTALYALDEVKHD